MKQALLLIVLSFLSLPAAWAERALEQHTLRYKGVERQYLLQQISEASTRLHPLILVLHGGGGNAQQIARSTQLSLEAAAGKFILVYPQGTGPSLGGKQIGTWNAGHCCGPAAQKDVDDVGFITTLIAELKQRYPIDAKRIYVVGISNGGAMSYRLACEASELFAGAAAVAAPPPLAVCPGIARVPFLHVHGTADRCVLFDPLRNGEIGVCGKDESGQQLSGGCFGAFLRGSERRTRAKECFPSPPIEEFYRARAREAKCDTTTTQQTFAETHCQEFSGCRAGSPAALCVIFGGGHSWPGAQESSFCSQDKDSRRCRRWLALVGETSTVPANRLILEFFARFPRASEHTQGASGSYSTSLYDTATE